LEIKSGAKCSDTSRRFFCSEGWSGTIQRAQQREPALVTKLFHSLLDTLGSVVVKSRSGNPIPKSCGEFRVHCDADRSREKPKDSVKARQDYIDKWNDTYPGHKHQVDQKTKPFGS
jgi:hypothetical protein